MSEHKIGKRITVVTSNSGVEIYDPSIYNPVEVDLQDLPTLIEVLQRIVEHKKLTDLEQKEATS